MPVSRRLLGRSILFFTLSLVSLAGLGASLGACEAGDRSAAAESAAESLAEHESAHGEPATAPLALSAEGTRFDPAVEASSLPEGAWICDMGTVHYARSVQGDGECPICHMRLVQRTTGDN